jgi:hypothetical protein
MPIVAKTPGNRALGREDSNLRMPVPKTGRIWPYLRHTLRNAPVIHKLESMAWQHSAEGFAQPAERAA